MATVTAFSPLTFYSAANGTPLDERDIADTQELPISREGGSLSLVSREGHTSSINIAAAIHATIAARQTLIERASQGDFPPFSSLTSRQEIPLFHTHPPLGELHASSRRVLDLLNLSTSLASSARATLYRACPACNTRLSRYDSPAQLHAQLSEQSEGARLSVEAIGPHDPLSRWATGLGFSATPLNETLSTAHLDTFPCERAAFETRHALLRSAILAPELALKISTPTQTNIFAHGGWCEKCNASRRVPTLAEIRDALSRGTGDALSLMVGERTLCMTLQTPLGELAQADLLPNLSKAMIRALGAANLTELRLETRLHDLSPRAVSALIMLTTLGETSVRGRHLLLDIPLNLFSPSEEASLLDSARELLGNSTALWIANTTRAPLCRPQEVLAPPSRHTLGELCPREGAPISMATHSISFIPNNRSSCITRLAVEAYTAITGGKSSYFNFSSASPHTVELVECFVACPSTPKLLAHEIGAIEPIAALFAASHQARTLGLSAKDFTISQTKAGPHICPTCRGAGVIICRFEKLAPPTIAPCCRCWGTRYRAPTRDVTFKGKTAWQVLNATIEQNASIFRALPKMSHMLDLARLLSVASLPLGIPVACLSLEQRRAAAIIGASMRGTFAKPVLVVLEEPFVGLSSSDIEGVYEAFRHPALAGKVAWVVISEQTPDIPTPS